MLSGVRRQPDSHRFEVLPRQWVVERTLAHPGMARPAPAAEQGLRGTAGNQRDLGSYCYGSSHAQKTETSLTSINHTPS